MTGGTHPAGAGQLPPELYADAAGTTIYNPVTFAGAVTHSGVVLVPAGTAGAPGLGVGEATTGLYQSGAGATSVLGLSTNGTSRATFTTATAIFATSFSIRTSIAAAAAIYATDAASTIRTDGTAATALHAPSGGCTVGGSYVAGAGSLSSPAYKMTDANTGWYDESVADRWSMSVGGAKGAHIALTSGFFDLSVALGTAGSPPIRGLTAVSSGVCFPSTTSVALSGNGTERVRCGSTGIGVFATAEAAQQVGGVTLTNNVTSGGTTNTINDIAAAGGDATAAKLTDTRDAIYQLARKLKLVTDALRTYGWLQNADA